MNNIKSDFLPTSLSISWVCKYKLESHSSTCNDVLHIL